MCVCVSVCVCVCVCVCTKNNIYQDISSVFCNRSPAKLVGYTLAKTKQITIFFTIRKLC